MVLTDVSTYQPSKKAFEEGRATGTQKLEEFWNFCFSYIGVTTTIPLLGLFWAEYWTVPVYYFFLSLPVTATFAFFVFAVNAVMIANCIELL